MGKRGWQSFRLPLALFCNDEEFLTLTVIARGKKGFILISFSYDGHFISRI